MRVIEAVWDVIFLIAPESNSPNSPEATSISAVQNEKTAVGGGGGRGAQELR